MGRENDDVDYRCPAISGVASKPMISANAEPGCGVDQLLTGPSSRVGAASRIGI